MTRAADRWVAWGDTGMMIMDLTPFCQTWALLPLKWKILKRQTRGDYCNGYTEINSLKCGRCSHHLLFFMLNTDYKLINNTNPRMKRVAVSSNTAFHRHTLLLRFEYAKTREAFVQSLHRGGEWKGRYLPPVIVGMRETTFQHSLRFRVGGCRFMRTEGERQEVLP